MKVYVATVDTRYEIMAVGATEQEAIQVAGKRAFEWLSEQGALTDRTDSVEKVIEYFDIWASEVEVGKAIIVGLEG